MTFNFSSANLHEINIHVTFNHEIQSYYVYSTCNTCISNSVYWPEHTQFGLFYMLRFPPTRTTVLILQILTDKLYLAPTAEDLPVLESHIPLYNLIPQKILSHIPSDHCVIPHSVTFKLHNLNVRPMNGSLGRKSYKIFVSKYQPCMSRMREEKHKSRQ